MSGNNALVIFGSTGDLTYTKLLPALAELITRKFQPIHRFIFVGRLVQNLEEYFSLGLEKGLSQETIDVLRPLSTYVYMQASDPKAYIALKEVIMPFEGRFFYLAVPPAMFHLISESLVINHLFIKGHINHRLAFEKPFGEHGHAAKVLNSLLHELALEEQLYRVDHYLAKPMIASLIDLRQRIPEVNALLNKDYVQTIRVTAYETVGILSRGKFYEATGALLDMVQSHLLFTLSRLGCLLPTSASIDAITLSQVQFLSALTVHQDDIVFGQYKGYLQEPFVNPNSIVETYVRLPFFSSLPSWKGVKMVIETGKKLSEKRTEITIEFIQQARLTLAIAPFTSIEYNDEFITLLNNAKALKKLTSYKLDHSYPMHAYTTIFEALISGDQQLFPDAIALEKTWEVCDLIKSYPRIPRPYESEADL
jgi:glucose-6-phosphate 1-dehydrogenase